MPMPARRAPVRQPLLVFSHRRWGVVHERPQHLLSRLATDFQVFFVEEPVLAAAGSEPRLASGMPAAGVEVLTPHVPAASPGFAGDALPALRTLLARFVAERGIGHAVVWLDTPAALSLASGLEPRAVVYDCAEDHPAAMPASGLPRSREGALMALSDLVLAAGPGLFEKHRGRHPNLHCVPGAVDAAHFAPERLRHDSLESAAARALHEGMPGPRLGFAGVIDGRIDLEFLAEVADLRPGWQLVMVGPVEGIDPAQLPRRANLHWLGPHTYEMLPYLQSHWDVAILPLAPERARATDATAALEHLAGGRPVVGTPVDDLVAQLGPAFRTVADAGGFVEAAEAAMREQGAALARSRMQARALVAERTWDIAAERVRTLLLDVLREGAVPIATQASPHRPSQALPAVPTALMAASLPARHAVPAVR